MTSRYPHLSLLTVPHLDLGTRSRLAPGGSGRQV